MTIGLSRRSGRVLGDLWQQFLLPRLLALGILKRRGTLDSGGVAVPFPIFGILMLLTVAVIVVLALVYLVPPGATPYP